MSRGLVLILVGLAAACSDDDDDEDICPAIGLFTGAGSVRWLDGVVRLPDRVYVVYGGNPQERECDFSPSPGDADTIAFSCPEGFAQGTLTVVLDRERWDTPFAILNGCDPTSQRRLDLLLDPAAGRPF